MSLSASIGDRVGDSDTSETDSAIVIGISNKPANKYEIKSTGETVKDMNQQYPSDDRVIIVTFESHLESIIPNWAFLTSRELTQKVMSRDVKTYAYPESRLFYINHGLLDGVTVHVSGVADPMNQKSGAYSFVIKSGDEQIYSESQIVEYGGSHVGKNTVIFEGMISALKWIKQNRPDYGVLIKTEDKSCVNQLKNNYDVQTEGDEILIYEIEMILDELPYYVISMEPKYNQKDLIEKSKETYKQMMSQNVA